MPFRHIGKLQWKRLSRQSSQPKGVVASSTFPQLRDGQVHPGASHYAARKDAVEGFAEHSGEDFFLNAGGTNYAP
jgi:hypothetical protein